MTPKRSFSITSGLSIGEEQFFLVVAILIGVYSGLAVVCFRISIEWLRLVLLGSALTPSFPRVPIVPVVAGLIVAALVVLVFPAVRGSGVNQTKAALYIYDGFISFRTVIGKFLTSRARDRQRAVARPRGSFAADRRRARIGDGPPAEAVARSAALHRAGRRRGRASRGVQLADHRRSLRHRRGHRPLDGRRARGGGAVGGGERGDGAVVSRRRASVPRAAVSPRARRRTDRVRGAWPPRRRGVARIREGRLRRSGQGCARSRPGPGTCNRRSRPCSSAVIGLRFPQVMGADTSTSTRRCTTSTGGGRSRHSAF